MIVRLIMYCNFIRLFASAIFILPTRVLSRAGQLLRPTRRGPEAEGETGSEFYHALLSPKRTG